MIAPKQFRQAFPADGKVSMCKSPERTLVQRAAAFGTGHRAQMSGHQATASTSRGAHCRDWPGASHAWRRRDDAGLVMQALSVQLSCLCIGRAQFFKVCVRRETRRKERDTVFQIW